MVEVELDDERLTKLCQVAVYHETKPEAFLLAEMWEWVGVDHGKMGEPDDDLAIPPVFGPDVARFTLALEGNDLTRLNALAAFFRKTANQRLHRRNAVDLLFHV